MTLNKALKTIIDECIEDYIYSVREDEGKGWDGPRVVAYGEACAAITSYLYQGCLKGSE